MPGTLPMIAGTGEAPSELVAWQGQLWTGSWGDYRLERFHLVPSGASWGARRETIVQGDETFRPVGLAVAPDGSLYFTDWVDKSYPVHGRGRIWRLRRREVDESSVLRLPPPTASQRVAATVAGGDWSVADLEHPDPFHRQAAIWALTRDTDLTSIFDQQLDSPLARVSRLQALRWRSEAADAPDWLSRTWIEEALRVSLQDEHASVRLYAVRWMADGQFTDLADSLDELVQDPSTTL